MWSVEAMQIARALDDGFGAGAVLEADGVAHLLAQPAAHLPDHELAISYHEKAQIEAVPPDKNLSGTTRSTLT